MIATVTLTEILARQVPEYVRKLKSLGKDNDTIVDDVVRCVKEAFEKEGMDPDLLETCKKQTVIWVYAWLSLQYWGT